MRRRLALAFTILACLSLAGFKPFAAVKNVCRECPQSPPPDTVTLADGNAVLAIVLADLEQAYLLERFGELRLLPKAEAKAVEYAGGTPRFDTVHDFVLLSNGTVLAGAVRRTEGARHLVIDLIGTNQETTVWLDRIDCIVAAGSGACRKP